MKFAHFADVHIGAWREPKLNPLSTTAFIQASEICLKENVDFVLISGDLFDTAIPSITLLKEVVLVLKKFQKKNISVYVVPGSHDFSNAGKTMIEILVAAELCHNVMRGGIENNAVKLSFTQDKKTGVKITGILGKKGMLDSSYYDSLDRTSLEQEPGDKIFMFHTAIAEFKPKSLQKMDAVPLSFFPKGFMYYAGGHVHEPLKKSSETYPLVTMPGPLFPVNFRELEKLEYGGFYMVTVKDSKADCEFIPIVLHNVVSFFWNVTGKTPTQVVEKAISEIKEKDIANAIVTMRFEGCLSVGTASSIDFDAMLQQCEQQQAFFSLKNTAKLVSESFSEQKYPNETTTAIEERVIKEHIGQTTALSSEEETKLIPLLMEALTKEKNEGETNITFEARLKSELAKILDLEL